MGDMATPQAERAIPPPRSARARSPRAGVDEGVAWHYGDPTASSGRPRGAGLVDRSDRDVVTVTGADRLTWLHSLTSQHLDALADASGSEALVLSPNGHVEHHLVLADLGGTTWADVEPGAGAALVDFLQKMRFMLRVEPALVTDRWAVLSLVGPNGPEVLAAAGLPAPDGVRRALDAASSAACRRSATAARRCSTSSCPRADIAAVARPAGRAARGHCRVRGAPGRGPASPLRRGQRPPDHPERAAVAADRRPPGQGLLPRPGDRRPGAQPGPAARAGWSCSTWTAQRGPGRARHAGAPARREVGRVGTVVRHHELGVIALALVKRAVEPGRRSSPAWSTRRSTPTMPRTQPT